MKIYSKLRNFIRRHKIISLVILVLMATGTYYGYSYFFAVAGETTYLVSEVKKGTIVTVVSGSGQVSAKSQIEIKPKASGEVVYVGAKAGDYVYAGQLIAQLDARDAQIALQSARLALQKMESTAVSDGGVSSKNYEEALNDINKTFIDMPTVLSGLNSILNNYSVSVYKNNLPNNLARDYLSTAATGYYQANKNYEKVLSDYRTMSKTTSDSEVNKLLDETYAMAKQLSSAAKQANTFVSYVYDMTDSSNRSTDLVSDRSSLGTWIQTIDSNLSALGSSRDTIRSSDLDIESQKLTVAQRENDYSDYFIRAPFGGTIGKLSVMMSDTISAGSSIGTFVTNQKLAEITLNEVDISKVKVGQKATLTFDAIEDFSLTGTVAEVDTVGTVSSGVVSYGVKISFDTQDSRVLPGMSVSASVATDVKQDVLVVPNSAIKTTNGVSTVSLAPIETALTDDGAAVGVTIVGATSTQVVTVGTADDTNTEILTGLKEGDKVIIKTIVASATKTAAPSIFSAAGVGNRTGSGTRTSSTRTNTSAGGPPAGI